MQNSPNQDIYNGAERKKKRIKRRKEKGKKGGREEGKERRKQEKFFLPSFGFQASIFHL